LRLLVLPAPDNGVVFQQWPWFERIPIYSKTGANRPLHSIFAAAWLVF